MSAAVLTPIAVSVREAADALSVSPDTIRRWYGDGILEGFRHKRVLRIYVASLELPKVTFHGLRHSAATNAVALGIPLEDVKQMLGHSSIRLTSDTYSHPDAGRAREVARLLGEGFSARSAVGSAVVADDEPTR